MIGLIKYQVPKNSKITAISVIEVAIRVFKRVEALSAAFNWVVVKTLPFYGEHVVILTHVGDLFLKRSLIVAPQLVRQNKAYNKPQNDY